GKVDSPRWRRAWDLVIMAGSWLPPLVVGIVLATTVLGLPLDATGDRVGAALAAVRPATVLGGVAIAAFSFAHGANFLTLKTSGDVRERARRVALWAVPVSLLPLMAFLAIVQSQHGELWTVLPLLTTLACGLIAWWRLACGRDGQAFAAFAGVILATAVTLFGALYPNVLNSTLDPLHGLTVSGA